MDSQSGSRVGGGGGRQSKPPRYRRVTQTLRKRLLEGNWAAGVKLPTLREMADEFKVSTNTVRTALRVLEKEGCIYHVPDVGAFVHPSSPLTTGARVTVAIAMIDIGGAFEMGIARGVEHACQERGWELQIYDARTDARIEARNLARLANSGSRGAIVMPIGNNANLEHLVRLKLSGYPVVLVDRGIIGLNVDVVESDHEKGACLATEYLIRCGHRRLFMVTFPVPEVGETSIIARFRGFEKALLAHGIEPTRQCMIWIDPQASIRGIQEGHRWLAGYEACVPVLGDAGKPIAVFALNDYVAWGVYEACRELGLRIPEDVSVACFDDSDIARALKPRLTVVAQQPHEIGRRAVELLERRLRSGARDEPSRREYVDVELIERESVCQLSESSRV